MPRAANRVVHHKAVGERAVVMGTVGADRENVASLTDQQDLFAAAMADESAAIGEFGEGNPLCEIRTMKGLFLRHRLSPLQSTVACGGKMATLSKEH